MPRHLIRIAAALAVATATACTAAPSAPLPSGASPVMLQTMVDVPVTVTNAAGTVGTWNFAGQSIAIPTGGNIDHVRFAWYHRRQDPRPTAFGRVYILDREYLGPPSGLSTSTPGFVGRSEAVAPVSSPHLQAEGEYVLPEALVLQAGTRYWFYTDSRGDFLNSFDEDLYAGGTGYVSGMPDLAFRIGTASGRMANGVFVPAPPGVTTDNNFRLRANVR